MAEPIIQFFSEETDFSVTDEPVLRTWLANVARNEQLGISFLNFVFCSDKYLLEMNRQYLDHDDYTDVITFPYSDPGEEVEGDVFISVERVADNAVIHNTGFNAELRRVMLHGLLHLLGYDDKAEPDKAEMRSKEDYYLSLLAV